MIELSPQVTATEAPDQERIHQKKAEEKDPVNSFSKLLQGLLKKTKQASGAEQSQEGLVPRKKSEPLLSMDLESAEGKEGLAVLFAPKDGMPKAADPLRKTGSPGISHDGETGILEKTNPQSREITRESLKKEELSPGKAVPVPAKADPETETAQMTGLLPSHAETADIPEEISLKDTELPPDQKDTRRLGLVDTLPGKTEESVIREFQFNRNAKPSVVDSDKAKDVPQEGKVRDKRKERIALEVQDQRAQAAEPQTVKQQVSPDSNPDQGVDAEIVVELKGGGSGKDEPGLVKENRNAQSFQDLLARELRDGLNTDIVRHASLVLRENGEGLIKLSLRPESLGNIKIRLEMADNKVTGHIILETDEALKAFEKEIRSLEQAFKDSGFDSANLEMALSSDQGNNGAGQQWRGEEAGPFFSERFAAGSYEALVDYEGRAGYGQEKDSSQVNMLV